MLLAVEIYFGASNSLLLVVLHLNFFSRHKISGSISVNKPLVLVEQGLATKMVFGTDSEEVLE